MSDGAGVEAIVLHAVACGLKSLDELPMLRDNSNDSDAKTSTGNQPQYKEGRGSSLFTEVHLGFNTIDSRSLVRLSCLATSLLTLILDNNELQNVAALPRLPLLHRLWLNNNCLDNLDAVLDVVLRQCPSLSYLSLLRNPCCPSELDGHLPTEYKRYRSYVKYMLPTLVRLDTAEFTEAEAQEARTKGKFARPALVKSPTANTLPAAAAAVVVVPYHLARSSTNECGRSSGEKKDVQVDVFGKFDQRRLEGPVAVTYISGIHSYPSGRGSEGNRFIGNGML